LHEMAIDRVNIEGEVPAPVPSVPLRCEPY
jgi:hypothetical protein